jgi:hypothetical protein
MPIAGLDPSWVYAVDEAVAKHLVFGRDFIFTFGPFGPVYTNFYYPATESLKLGDSILIAFAICAGFALLAWPRRLFLLLLLPIVVAEQALHDVSLMALPLLLLLIVLRLGAPSESPLHLPLTPLTGLGISLLSCAVGVLPLIKGTLLGLAIAEGGLAIVVAIVGGQTRLAFGIASLAILSLCVGWVVAGQPLAALPHYFFAQEQIIAGYSEAMSLHGPFREALYWAGAMAAITATFYAFAARRRGLAGWLIFLGFAFYSFVAFKEGFVRQDVHVLISAETFLFIGLFLAALLEPRPAIAVAAIACLGWVAIERSATDFSAATVLARIENTARGAANGIISRIGPSDILPVAFARANAAIRRASPLPPVKGTVDLYPWDLSFLFAAGMKWDGRPIPQSYSAYTPALEEANAAHLIGGNAPDNVFFAVAPIDGRLPAIEDALSWPLLLSRYSIVGFHGDYLQMLRAAHPARMRLDGRAVRVGARLNKWIDVPSVGRLVWARIGMRPTLFGKLVLAAFKLPQVQIELRLADGRTVRHRYIPEMGRAGFLLSPYVASTSDFGMMAAGLGRRHDVRQIRLDAPRVGLWARRIGVSFKELHIAPQQGVRQLLLTEPSSPPAFVSAGKIGSGFFGESRFARAIRRAKADHLLRA